MCVSTLCVYRFADSTYIWWIKMTKNLFQTRLREDGHLSSVHDRQLGLSGLFDEVTWCETENSLG